MTTPHDGDDRNDLFRFLYKRYYARMLRYFRQVFRLSEADAQELSQDSFLRFYRAMDEYRGEAEWALLETIARNVGYNRVRSVTTAKRGRIRPESRMRQAIAELPAGQRQCLQLYLEDFSQEEISRTLQISIVAVKSRIRDAKRALRERLGDEDALPEDES
jgi:RNA polymerase sigma factor (sigma-70 family)